MSRMEVDHEVKMALKIGKDIESRPIDVNVQSPGVFKEEQEFFIEDDNETEEQFWEQKKAPNRTQGQRDSHTD